MGFATKEMMGEEKQLVTNIGLKIVLLRSERELPRAELAKQAELHPQYLYDVEMGKRNVTIYVLGKIARAFNITLSELLEPHTLPPVD
ncbi:helix-turn-helix transcriptional regulator [Erysipelothrix sp. HDW6B]|uniref:helix-turn-helix domain-containing protein n=1 Tax=Erysipelothrix sp. HDW6B TaxID=2714929 RepID=UPI00140DA4EA|nr:helix-turn-helix transcriptional regulator [Erysipelothrix sp. HDW6B]QIK86644.1 helix-turn-helix transcriptional regulator [Erysipelothrix sp. HDW6B]